jgi:hypothetical protein
VVSRGRRGSRLCDHEVFLTPFALTVSCEERAYCMHSRVVGKFGFKLPNPVCGLRFHGRSRVSGWPTIRESSDEKLVSED